MEKEDYKDGLYSHCKYNSLYMGTSRTISSVQKYKTVKYNEMLKNETKITCRNKNILDISNKIMKKL